MLVTTFLITQAMGQTGEALNFSNFGPVAFDSFWRIPTVTSGYDQLTFRTFSRFSADDISNNYFTQYFRVDIPIGGQNGLSVRVPWHRYNVGAAGALQRGMANEKGSEWGDIDFIFTINAFQSFFDRWAGGKYKLLFIGEMHTAPTSRANRQFTDTLKMLGLIGITGTWPLGSGTFVARTFVGVGGWQDDELPRQNHILKVSSSMAYQQSFSTNWAWGVGLGSTVLRGEKGGDDGFYWQGTVFLRAPRSRELRLGFGNINYTQSPGGGVSQVQIGISLPIWFSGFQRVDVFSGP